MKLFRLLIVLAVCAAFSFPLTAYAASLTPVQDSSTPVAVFRNNNNRDYYTFGIDYNGDPIQHPDVKSGDVKQLWFYFDFNNQFSVDDVITGSYNSVLGNVAGSGFEVSLIYDDGSQSSYVPAGGESGNFKITVEKATKGVQLRFRSTGLRYGDDLDGQATTRFRLVVNTAGATDGLLSQIIELIKSIPDSFSSFFSSLTNSLKDWFSNVGEWFSDLGDSIGQWFTDLKNNISNFFTTLGNNISGFFEKLWNRIYWGNENGESEYQPPVFSSSLDEVLDKIDDYITQLEDTNSEIENAKVQSVSYVKHATTVINSIFGVFPSVLIALVVFGVVFVFCRKVVGR